MVWIAGYYGTAISIKKSIKKVIISETFQRIIIFAVIANTFSLACEGIDFDEEIQNFRTKTNDWFTYIFLGEMILKLIGFGIK